MFTYDLASGAPTPWTRASAQDDGVVPELVRVESLDGVEVPAWIYRAPHEGPRPAVLWIHGGPEEQSRPSFDPIIQFLARELGVTVVAPNLRGSLGYGRTYAQLDDGARREDAIRDVGAVLEWLAADAAIDAERVGIHGASYGGYVVLASLAAYPDRLTAGCDVVGISSFVSFLENTRAYRRALRRREYGDESDEEMRAFLASISPLARADRIRAPLFVAHGANDPRVPVAEALQIADAVRAGGHEVWLMVAPDEGHGFSRRANRDAFYRLFARFWERHLLAAAPTEG